MRPDPHPVLPSHPAQALQSHPQTRARAAAGPQLPLDDGGSALSMLGDQFTLSHCWLVLKLTGDTLVLGTVLALMSMPRALFILIGGALVDRHSPKQVLMLSKYANLAAAGRPGWKLVLAGTLTL
jgi:hypothetical protein